MLRAGDEDDVRGEELCYKRHTAADVHWILRAKRSRELTLLFLFTHLKRSTFIPLILSTSGRCIKTKERTFPKNFFVF